ncbi:MAG: hypothetical protein E6I62_01445 [Chloroflexi bacterium]|nr:MAG: hypothetical protein E6I62_01445 [Chloroflexota bacterium]
MTTRLGSDVRRRARTSTRFQLHAANLAESVQVCLQSFGDRWVATAAGSRRIETGLGSTARTALTAAVESLMPAAAAELLTDPELLAVSWQIRQAV